MSATPEATQAVLRLVVLGTGTGVGKTWLSTALVRAFVDLGLAAAGVKPVESGVEPGTPTDAALLGGAGACAVAMGPLYGFPDPLSPHLAARRASVGIDLASIAQWVHHAEERLRLTNANDNALHVVHGHTTAVAGSARDPVVSIVESAGGVFSPLSDTLTNLDLASALEPAIWILVAPDALGVLHAVRATTLAMEGQRRAPDHVVLCAAHSADASTGCNADEIRRLGWHPSVLEVRHEAPDDVAPLARTILRAHGHAAR